MSSNYVNEKHLKGEEAALSNGCLTFDLRINDAIPAVFITLTFLELP